MSRRVSGSRLDDIHTGFHYELRGKVAVDEVVVYRLEDGSAVRARG